MAALFDTTEESRENKPSQGKGQKQVAQQYWNLDLSKVFFPFLDKYNNANNDMIRKGFKKKNVKKYGLLPNRGGGLRGW